MDGKRVRVLVADDDDLFRQWLCAELLNAEFEVLEASNGDDALALCRTQPVDVIVCDMFMPKKDGLETIQALRHEFPRMRVVAVSGGSHQGAIDVLRMAQLMGAELLSKPFKAAALLAKIQGSMKK